MRRSILIAAMIVALSARPPLQAEESIPLVPVDAVESSYQTVDGGTVSLAEYRGSVVLLHFFASWCGECIIEAPSLARLSRSMESADFEVIGVVVDDDPVSAKNFVVSQRIPFPVIVDTSGALKKRFLVRGVPMTTMLNREGKQALFIDPATGKSVSRIDGARAWDSSEARRSIEHALGGVGDSPKAATVSLR